MPVPKKRTSRSKRDMRRAHDGLSPVMTIVCPQCAEPMRRHRICMACGYYRSRQLVAVESEA